jgi:uncharacterized membrane protein
MSKVSFVFAVVFAAAISSGIVGGIFYAFSSFVMTALSHMPPAQGVTAMNSISVAVINVSFMTVFMGTAILSLVVGVASPVMWNEPGAKFALAGSIVYLVGCVGVTMIFNVPLNDRLATMGDTAQAIAFWPSYLASWILWNHVRSVAGILSAALLTLAVSQR